MTAISIIAPPLVGGFIGYLTNYLAIKMLFRPLYPVYIGKYKLPLTPGIVPKRKEALANILGSAVVDRFFNADDLELIFTSDHFKNAVADSVVERLYENNTPLGALMGGLKPGTPGGALADKAKDSICERVQEAILEADLSAIIAEKGEQVIQKRFGRSALGKVLGKGAVSSMSGPLGEEVEKYIRNDGKAVIMPFLDKALEDAAEKSLSEVVAGAAPDKEGTHKMVCEVYTKFMRTQVRHIVESIDVGGTITEKFRLLDPGEIEALVLAVVNREFRYVELLGGVIGAVIGAVNIFI
ncbi:MAG: DUF445 family protein [Clostridiales bacterium]|nr:DUF445 family protein [Clostridiales bacterium]